ncbi:NAD(P)/FAD-dependent oxidoreductase [Halobellus rubicundus]|uniref:NAD(P)/FAD-dependent oxidoreductase n=1 Tax=Halobellus rubicundus TaxID=2996466 RepID=A0ABD5MCQ6_9EURY
MTHDLIIVGTGPAGLTAGAYAGRSGLDVLFFERESIGGDLVNRHEVRSYPGFPDGISGTELRGKMVEAAEAYDPEVQLETVERIEPGEPHVLHTGGNEYEATAVILAPGGTEQRLGVPSEEEYEGRGVFHCAACDGPLYRDERIAVVGGRNHALIDAVFLTEYASEVLLVDSKPELDGDDTLVDEVTSHPDIEVRTDTTVTEVVGEDGLLTGVEVERGGSSETERLELGGLNVNVGCVPNTGFLEGTVDLDDEGRIVVDHRMESSAPGIYAAGDARQDSPLEIAAAVGDGTTAITAAKEYIARHGE